MYIRTNDRLGEHSPPEPGLVDKAKRAIEIALGPSPLVTGEVPFRDYIPFIAQKQIQEIMGKAIAAGTPKFQQAKARMKAAIPREKTCWIQTILNKTSAENLVQDGVYGPKTREAVRRFQSRYGLSADGIVGPKTSTALVQIALNNIAQASLLPVNGVMDARVNEEIKRFQTAKNLAADGIVGVKTRAVMVLALGGECRMPAPGTIVKPPPPPPLDCDALLKHCRDQSTQYIVNAAIQFGVDESWAISIARTTIQLASLASRVPPLAVIIAILGSIPAGILNARAIHRLATAIREILVGYITCIRNAKAAAKCP